MGNQSSSSASSGLGSSSSSSSSAFAGNDTEFKQAKQKLLQKYSDIMHRRLKYDVYLIRNEGIHHFLVLHYKERQVSIRLELTQEWGKTIFLQSDYKGTLRDEDHQGEIENTLDNIFSIGSQIIRDYKEEYQLFHQNCQEFCNEYLQQLGLSGYITHSLMARVGWSVLKWWYRIP